MKILILEDNLEKLKQIKSIIKGHVDNKDILECKSINEAKKILREKLFDFFFVDLKVPIREGEAPGNKSGIELIKILKTDDRYNYPKNIYIISEYEDILQENEELFKDQCLHSIFYNKKSRSWEAQIEQILREAKRSKGVKKLIFSLHGIWATGDWQKKLSTLITSLDISCVYLPWDYGYKLTPFFGKKQIKEFHNYYNQMLTSYGTNDNELIVIAHSFGTHILKEALLSYPEIKFDKIILLGNIIEKDFNWDKLKDAGKVGKILSYTGEKDWILKYSVFIKGLGNAGKVGFSKKYEYLEEKKYTDLDHSDMFGTNNMEKYWIPFLENGCQ